jgi:prefoldin subunit 5
MGGFEFDEIRDLDQIECIKMELQGLWQTVNRLENTIKEIAKALKGLDSLVDDHLRICHHLKPK